MRPRRTRCDVSAANRDIGERERDEREMKERDPRVVHCRGGAGTQSQWKGCRRKDGRVSDSRPSRPVHASTYRAEKSQKRQKHQMRVYREGGREKEKKKAAPTSDGAD